ncbi:MAG: hypothetical protein Q4E13_06450, partial [Clostridia bacterium]|nr:hypothetical protein [Clostridia bacterium]
AAVLRALDEGDRTADICAKGMCNRLHRDGLEDRTGDLKPGRPCAIPSADMMLRALPTAKPPSFARWTRATAPPTSAPGWESLVFHTRGQSLEILPPDWNQGPPASEPEQGSGRATGREATGFRQMI